MNFDEIASVLDTVMGAYGFWGVMEIILIVSLSQLIKWPLKKFAEAWAKTKGKDKVAYTAWFYFLPLALALILTFVFYSWRWLHWDFDKFDWSNYFSLTASLAAMAEALYSGIELFSKKYLAYRVAKDKQIEETGQAFKASATATAIVDGIESTQTVEVTRRAPTLEKARKLAEKAARKEAFEAAKADAVKQARIKAAEKALEEARKS